jgi:hypothetical protein
LVSGATRPDVRAGAEMRVGAGEAEQLGDAQPGLDGGEQQRVVAPADPCCSVRGVEQRLRFDRGEERPPARSKVAAHTSSSTARGDHEDQAAPRIPHDARTFNAMSA